ncbi:MAG: putative secreted protein [Frankiales bacterium]|nr:putative secreted protein [Frankiales bacterium]
MTRRLFYIAFGAAAGVIAVRRATQAAQRYTPAGLQQRAGGAFGSLGDAVRDFAAEVKVAMSEREVELREALGLDGRNDQIDAPPL